jgi:hypothetical protein
VSGGLFRAAAALVVVALALVGRASGAGSYTGPVAGVPWAPATLSDAAVGVPYSATVTATPAGAVQLAVACKSSDLGSAFPPPPVALNTCALPPGLTATAGPSLTISGTPTTEGTYAIRLIAVWKDASGGDFYTLQRYALKVATTSASPPCHCTSVGAKVTKVAFAGSTASLSVDLSLRCSGGSGSGCKGTVSLKPPAGAAWTGLQLPGDDKPVPVASGKARVALSCYGPCDGGARLSMRLVLAHAPRHGTWRIAATPTCPGGKARATTLVVRV